MNSARYPFEIVVFFTAVILSTGCAYAATPWESYLDLPTEENAELVRTISWSSDSDGRVRNNGERILDLQIEAGSPAALRLAIRLSSTDDTGLREDLNSLIGGSVRGQTRNFVAEMSKAEITQFQLKTILMRAGEAYLDRPAAQMFELQKRRDALSSIVRLNPREASFVKQALAILDEDLKQNPRSTK